MGGGLESEHTPDLPAYNNRFADELTPEQAEQARRDEPPRVRPGTKPGVVTGEEHSPSRMYRTPIDPYLQAVRRYCDEHYTLCGVLRRWWRSLRQWLRRKTARARVVLGLTLYARRRGRKNRGLPLKVWLSALWARASGLLRRPRPGEGDR